MKILTILQMSLLVLGLGKVYAQSNAAAGFDIGTAMSDKSWTPSIYYHEEIGSQKLSWLRFSLGFRLWGHYANQTNLISKGDVEPHDILKFNHLSANGLSFVIGANVRIWKLDLGVNTDLGGIGFGSKRAGLYLDNRLSTELTQTGSNYYNTRIAASPKLLNGIPLLFEGSSGQSEAYSRIWITRQVGIKLGCTFGRQVYKLNKVNDEKIVLSQGKDLFFYKYTQPYIAITFNL